MNDTVPGTVGARLRRWRRRQHPELTGLELGKLLGISEPYVSLLERGERYPSWGVAQQIYAVTGIRPEQWMHEAESKRQAGG